MRAIVPSISIKGFQSVLLCLAKIGDDVVLEARPDGLVLSTINITRSAYASFSFSCSFFETFQLDLDGEAIRHDQKGPYLRCSVLAKALVSACKIRGKIEEKTEKLVFIMNAAEGVGENCFIKVHKLLYESCPDPLQVIDSIASCPNSWRLSPVAMNGFAEAFSSKAEEISMNCTQDEVTFKTFRDTTETDGGGPKKVGTTTDFPIFRNAMEQYNLQNDIEITFSFKEFKTYSANARNGGTHSDVDLTQAENALFLDDDTNWAGVLDDIEMEGEEANSDGTQHEAVKQGDRAAGVAQEHGAPYEIEEEFLPTQRESKRLRFTFDEDEDEDS
ncbi:Cell cycle checkpoint control protein rad9b [Mortierella polycephala]|uniref:Cell cycle checkpoint control protein rad9b n=1 Tax=Mortierella polycephala TaxID=41804 RepID=A0A9P6U0S4_9FUNG|nr:Cell cycle checkpoint control protein rad9b [Mortierella polycephala]